MRALKYIWKTYLIFLCIFIIFVITGVFLPHDNDLLGQTGRCETVEKNISGNGSFDKLIRLPYHYSLKPGEQEELNVNLFGIKNGEYAFIYTGDIDTKVYLNKILVKDSGQEGKTLAKWIQVPLFADEASQSLKIVMQSGDSKKSGTIEKIYIGDRGCVIGRILGSFLPVIISALLIFVMGLVIVIYFFISKWMDFAFIGIAMILFGIDSLLMPQLRQAVTGNLLMVDLVSRIIFIFMMISFTIGLYEIGPHYKEKMIKHTFVLYAVTLLVSVILRYSQPNDNLYLSFLYCGFAVVCVVFTKQFVTYMNTHKREQHNDMLRDKEKDEFLADMSHAIRTPVNTIIGMNTMIQRKTQDEATREYSEEIKNAAESLVSIIDDILDMSKISDGTPQINCQEYDLKKLINDCYNMISFKTTSKNLNFTISNDPDIPLHLIGDEPRIRQILVNLLMNAAKYTNVGGISLDIGFRPVSDTSIILDLEVTDTGIGIRNKDIKLIYDSFERTDVEKNLSEEGNGLGLRIVKNFVEIMDGRISVKSKYGEGSTFKVSLPQRYKGSEKIGDCSEKIQKSSEQKDEPIKWFRAPDARILVIDDVEMNIRVITELLGKTEMTIDTAGSGSRGLELIAAKRYDIIFLDHMMPEMDGIETYRRMRRLEKNPNFDTPVIMLTANAIKGAKEDYLKEGFNDYIAKPVSEQDLVDICRKYLPQGLVFDTGSESENDETGEGETDEILDRLSDILNIKEGMMYCVNKRDFYLEMLSDYVRSGYFAKLEENYKENDLENYRINVHTVKSSSRTLGADDISEEAKALETAAKNGDSDYIRANHEKLIKDNEILIGRISEIIDVLDKEKKDMPKHEITHDHLKDLLVQANKCAYIFDIDGVEKVTDELESSILTEDMGDKLVELRKAADEIEFDDMARITKEMISMV